MRDHFQDTFVPQLQRTAAKSEALYRAAGLLYDNVRGVSASRNQASDLARACEQAAGTSGVGGLSLGLRRALLGCGAGPAVDGRSSWTGQPHQGILTFPTIVPDPRLEPGRYALVARWLGESIKDHGLHHFEVLG